MDGCCASALPVDVDARAAAGDDDVFSHFPIAAVGDIARRVYFLRVYLRYLYCMLARLCHLVSQILQETRVESTALMLKYFHTSEVAITSTSS